MDLPTTVDFPVPLPAVLRAGAWEATAGDIAVRLTNPEKVFWPENGYTKGDLLTYYFNVALTIVPHLRDRPLTMKRQPDGVAGAYFYEKDAPSYTPAWMPTLNVRAKTEPRTIRALTICDVASLLFVVNLGCIELHPWLAVGPDQERPSYAVFDLDPFPPAAWDEVVYVAGLLRTALDELGLQGFPKTSGAEGLQVFVPTDGSQPFDEVRAFAAAVSRMIHQADPAATTLEWEVGRRAGRIFLDERMNRRAASFASAYSVRSRWGAPVSVPVEWSELASIDPLDFTIETVLPRLLPKGDLFAPTLEANQSLSGALAKLGIA